MTFNNVFTIKQKSLVAILLLLYLTFVRGSHLFVEGVVHGDKPVCWVGV